MSSPAERSVAHITFKRDRKSGSYVPDKTYPSLSPYRVQPTRRRHSSITSVIVDSSTGKVVPTLDSFLGDSSRAQSRARSRARSGLRQSVRASSPVEHDDRRGSESGTRVDEEGEREPGEEPMPEVPVSFATGLDDRPAPTSPPLPPRPSSAAPVSPTPPHLPPSSQEQPIKLGFDTLQELEVALSTAAMDDLPGQRALTDLLLHSPPLLPLLPPLPLLIHTALRVLSPTPLPPLLPQLLALLAQIEQHRQLLVSQARRALELHESAGKGAKGRLGREQRRVLRGVAGERVDGAERRKWWALGIHLRRTHIREMLTLNPYTDPALLLSPHFPAQPTVSTLHLSPTEQTEHLALHQRCQQLITDVSRWASAFTGTPQEAQREFEERWPMVPGWDVTREVVLGYCREVGRAEGVLREVFALPLGGAEQGGQGHGHGEAVKIEPLQEMGGAAKLEPISPTQHLVRVVS
ncbi:hypothetical protein CALCODRAFT_480157 [Calocera cornea HHB12733]|uniref:Uncharacterized protein n=1 Tax=Calocera cornea HHB12733 TaxID=1353952 RepID=A0A165J0L2_9BASI|nr:hypothetical protein CALCODRAFT_480157 [Calocera cornea HHB12733]